jgi:peroxiredoxin
MSGQPKALQLADACNALTKTLMIVPGLDTVECEAELRRLHEVNAELLEALKSIICWKGSRPVWTWRSVGHDDGDGWYTVSLHEDEVQAARAAIAKATGEQ